MINGDGHLGRREYQIALWLDWIGLDVYDDGWELVELLGWVRMRLRLDRRMHAHHMHTHTHTRRAWMLIYIDIAIFLERALTTDSRE